MVKIKSKNPVSNRQRAITKKKAPKAPRLQPVATVAAPLRVRTTVQQGIPDQVAALEAKRAAAAIAAAEAEAAAAGSSLTPKDRRAIAAEYGVDWRDGGMRARSRDGLRSLHKSKALTDDDYTAGMAFRLCYEAAGAGLKVASLGDRVSGANRAGAAAAELHRAYLMARLNGMETAVDGAMVDGRELLALRMIAGEGRPVSSFSSGGKARAVYTEALKRALAAIHPLLGSRRDLRIEGS